MSMDLISWAFKKPGQESTTKKKRVRRNFIAPRCFNLSEWKFISMSALSTGIIGQVAQRFNSRHVLIPGGTSTCVKLATISRKKVLRSSPWVHHSQSHFVFKKLQRNPVF